MAEIAITVSNLKKAYKKFIALHDISFEIPQGKIIGILGPNGAGKSTLIKSLVGAIKPNSGDITVLGKHPLKDKWKLRKEIGYMPQDPSLYEDLSVKENISFFAKGTHNHISKGDIEHILTFTELANRAHSQVFTLSGGSKKRVSLACTLVNQPQILFLDEPTAAVDPYLKIKSWQLFREITSQGKTILISTHLMDEALLCDTLMILREGTLLTIDTPRNIMKYGKVTLSIKENGMVHDEVTQNSPEAIAEKLHEYGIRETIESIDLLPQNLDDIIISLTKEKVL